MSHKTSIKVAELRDQLVNEVEYYNDGFFYNTLYYDNVHIIDWIKDFNKHGILYITFG